MSPPVAAHPVDDPDVAALAAAALRPRLVGPLGTASIVDCPEHARIAAMVAAGPDPVVAASLLAALLAALPLGGADADGTPEVTGWWAPNLAPGAQPGRGDALGAIAAAALDAAARVGDLGEALVALDSVPQPLRRRLRLELIRRHLDAPEAPAAAVRELVTAADVWAPAIDREWAMLAAGAASLLDESARRAVVAAIGIDPDADPQAPPPPPPGLDACRAAAWPRRWLARAFAVADLLPGPWRDAVRAASPTGFDPAAVRRCEARTYRPTGVVEDPTAIAFGDLVDTAVARLRAAADEPTRPQPEPGRPAPPGSVADLAEGVGSDLDAAAAADPAGAVTALTALRTVPARAARGAVAGLHRAAQQGATVAWAAVAAYAQEVLDAGPTDE